MSLRKNIRVGISENVKEIRGSFLGSYLLMGKDEISGGFKAFVEEGKIIVVTKVRRYEFHSKEVYLLGRENSRFELEDVLVGKGFHWEKRRRLVFPGDLVLRLENTQSLCVINEVDPEEYLKIVISSEMNPNLPKEYLKAHAVISRSWLFANLRRKDKGNEFLREEPGFKFYDSRIHALYDVCSEDHCQRYHGIVDDLPREVEEAIRETEGIVLKYHGEICDTRYSKCCGGLTEEYRTAWEERDIPYLSSVPCSLSQIHPIRTESEFERWVSERPDVFCNVRDPDFLSTILGETDENTKEFFRWRVDFQAEELEETVKRKTGLDLGHLKNLKVLERGPSGRIKRLLLEGEKGSLIVGKELEIRRVLSHTHLLSSAFKVILERDRKGYIRRGRLLGAGWGHGVGLCQIGAASMALSGFKYEQILSHYYRGSELSNIYEADI